MLRGARMAYVGTPRGISEAPKKNLKESTGKFITGDIGGGGELLALAEADEMIPPGNESAGRIESAFEEMKSGGAIVIVVKIVFAGPEEFYGDADLFGDGTGFEHVVVGEAAAESATGALHVNDDVVVRNVQNF